MNILITGANGFIGRNLIAQLLNKGYSGLFLCDRETEEKQLEEYIQNSDFIFHLAGVNRPENEKEFMEGNSGFTDHLIGILKKYNKKVPMLISSSIQADLDNPYGKSKLKAEQSIINFSEEWGNEIFLYRLANVFGKWCRPNYNSVVATFCYNIARQKEIKIHDPKTMIQLVYIDDVVEEFVRCMEDKETHKRQKREVQPSYQISLKGLSEVINSFYESRLNFTVPDMGNELIKKLYSTYLSYLPEELFSYPLKKNVDERGSFVEFLKLQNRGQVSVNIIKPGIVKGNHWHNTKNEKFLVVRGSSLICFRKLGDKEVVEYRVSGDDMLVIDIPTGYTHNIMNMGIEDLIVVMWANEEYDPEHPDTYFEQV